MGRSGPRVAIAISILLVIGLNFSGASGAEEDVGCSYFAPATVGTAGAADSPPAPIASNTGETLSAGCGDAFKCLDGCTLGMLFGFTGTGIVSGEVEIIGSYFTPEGAGVVFRAFHTACGPALAVPRGGCFGSFTTTLPPADDYLLVCKADGVAAVQVNGYCTGLFG